MIDRHSDSATDVEPWTAIVDDGFERQRDGDVVEPFAALDRNEQLRVEAAAVVDGDRRRPSSRCPDRR